VNDSLLPLIVQFICVTTNVHIVRAGWGAIFAQIERSRRSKQFWYIWRRTVAHFFIWKVCKGVCRLL